MLTRAPRFGARAMSAWSARTRFAPPRQYRVHGHIPPSTTEIQDKKSDTPSAYARATEYPGIYAGYNQDPRQPVLETQVHNLLNTPLFLPMQTPSTDSFAAKAKTYRNAINEYHLPVSFAAKQKHNAKLLHHLSIKKFRAYK